MELWDQVEAIDEPVTVDWVRLVIDRWCHKEMGAVSHIMSSSVAARQSSAPKINGKVKSRGAV